jgi:lipopolysaccharide export LptBFGC system permease protein LptF
VEEIKIYNPELKYFIVVIKEVIGEQETYVDIIVQSNDINEAEKKADKISREWFEGDTYFQATDSDYIEYESGVLVKVNSIREINPIEFFERHIY